MLSYVGEQLQRKRCGTRSINLPVTSNSTEELFFDPRPRSKCFYLGEPRLTSGISSSSSSFSSSSSSSSLSSSASSSVDIVDAKRDCREREIKKKGDKGRHRGIEKEIESGRCQRSFLQQKPAWASWIYSYIYINMYVYE